MDALAARAACLSAAALVAGAFDLASTLAQPDWALALAGALPVAVLGLFVLIEPKRTRIA